MADLDTTVSTVVSASVAEAITVIDAAVEAFNRAVVTSWWNGVKASGNIESGTASGAGTAVRAAITAYGDDREDAAPGFTKFDIDAALEAVSSPDITRRDLMNVRRKLRDRLTDFLPED